MNNAMLRLKTTLDAALRLLLSAALVGWPGPLGVGVSSAQAAPPTVTHFQGRLTDASNNPLSGAQNFQFEIYDAPAAGSLLWSETQNGVNVVNGVFNVELGAVTPLTPDVFRAGTTYLRVIVNGTPMSPRERLATSPFSFNSWLLEGRDYAHFVTTSTIQTIAGDKTFTGQVVVPTPTLPGHATTKNYVDTQAVGASGWTRTGAVVSLTAETDNAVVQSTLTVKGNEFSVGSSRLFVSAAGVGVGTTNPGTTFDVNGNVRSSGFQLGALSVLYKSGNDLLLNNTGADAIQFTLAGAESARVDAAGLSMASGKNITLAGGGKVTGLPTPSAASDAANKAYVDSTGGGWTKTGSVVALTSPADNAVVQSTLTVKGDAFSVGVSTLVVMNGRVGVGTTSPSSVALLDVQGGDINIGGALRTGTNQRLTSTGDLINIPSINSVIYPGANVGVGTSGPQTRLDVNGNAQFGSGATKSTFTATGALTIAANQNITVSGTGRLTGLPAPTAASDAVNKAYVDSTGGGWTKTGAVVALTTETDNAVVRSSFTVYGPALATGLISANGGITLGANQALNLSGASGNIVAGSSITTAGGLFGDGQGVTNLNATNLLTGTVNDARLPGTMTAKTFSGAITANAGIAMGSGQNVALAGGGTVTGVPTPSAGTDAANKAYVDTQAVGASGWTKTGAVVAVTNPGDNAVVQSTLTVQGNAFSVGGSTLVVSSGRIGIATTNPLDRVHIAGSSVLRFDAGGSQKWSDGTYETILDMVSGVDGGLRVRPAGLGTSTAFHVVRSGADVAVGVGTSSPGSKLDVAGSAQFGAGAAKSTFTAAGALALASGASVALSGGGKVTGLAAPSVPSDAATKAYVDSTGGGWTKTGSVIALSNATDNAVVQSTLTVQGNAFSVGGSTFVVRAGRVGIGTTDPGVLGLDIQLGALQVGSGGSNFNAYTTGNGAVIGPSAGSSGASMFYTTLGGGRHEFSIGGAEKARIHSSGDVGIGATLPTARLHVSSASAVSGDNVLLVSSGTAGGQELLVVKGGGNVGIGASNPTQGRLTISHSNTSGDPRHLALIRPSNANEAALSWYTGSTWDWWMGTDDVGTNDFHLWSAATGYVFTGSKATGFLGVGTAAPATRLDVNGDAQFGSGATKSTFTATGALNIAANANVTLSGTGKVTGLATPTANSDAATKQYVDSQIGGAGGWTKSGAVVSLATPTDSVGVGTAGPSTKLDVNGDAQFGSGATKSTFTATGSLVMASGTTVRSGNGAAAAPTFSFTGDTDTGMFWGGSDQIDFATGGTQRLTIHASGLSGSINFVTTGQVMSGDGTAAAPGYRFGSDAGTGLYRPGASILAVSAGGAEAARFTSTGMTMAAGKGITLSGSAGTIVSGSSITTSGSFFGPLVGNVTGNVTGNAGTATALAANGLNCAAGSLAAGVDASGAAEGCVDVGTQAELDAHAALTNTAHGATSANTVSTLVARDASGNFSAGTITAALTGAASSNVLKAGDTMTGQLNMSNVAVNLTGAAGHVVSRSSITTSGGLFGNGAGITNLTPGNISAGTAGISVTGNAGTATALAANGLNCAAGSLAAGVDASGAAEGCVDVGTQAELDAHAALTNTAHGATSANTVSTLVARDASGNFSAGTITASINGNISGNAASATNVASGAVGQMPYQTGASATGFLPAMASGGIIVGNGTSVIPSTATLQGTASQVTVTKTAAAVTLSLPATINVNTSGNAATATALAVNAGNCAAGSLAAGVDASGAAEGCVDVGTQAELDAHAALTNTAHGATSANTVSTLVARDASGNFSAGTITATLSGSITGNAATADRLTFEDNRDISPSENSANRMKFGFTSFANNGTAPYADFLHLRSYGDATGGNDNLVMFRKDAIGMRLWQQSFGSATNYSSFKDVALADSQTQNYLPKWGSTAGYLQNSQLFDNGTNVGVGTTSPQTKLQVSGSAAASGWIGGAGTTGTAGTAGNTWRLGSAAADGTSSPSGWLYLYNGAGSGYHDIAAGRVWANSTLYASGEDTDARYVRTSQRLNEYVKAQFTLSGGGTVTWGGAGGRLRWTSRFIAIPVQRTATSSVGYIDINQCTANIPAGQVYDGVARACDATGVVLNSWEALYAEHAIGGNNVAITYYIVRYTNDFSPPSNWILVAAINGDDNSAKLGTGLTLRSGGTWNGGNGYDRVLGGGTNATGAGLNDTTITNTLFFGTGGSYKVSNAGAATLAASTVGNLTKDSQSFHFGTTSGADGVGDKFVFWNGATGTGARVFSVKWDPADLRFETFSIQHNNAGADVAEMIQAREGVEAGDVVSVSVTGSEVVGPRGETAMVERSGSPYDSRIVGVISDSKLAGLMLSGMSPEDTMNGRVHPGQPLVLAGRVMVKVSLENGPIKPGDYLTSSSRPGYAMRATAPGPTVGIALEGFDGSSGSVGKVLCLVDIGERNSGEKVKELERRLETLERILLRTGRMGGAR